MLTNDYGFDQECIDSLGKVSARVTNKVYHYKGVYFLWKPVLNAKNLLVSFNGAIREHMVGRLVFRGYNYQFENTSILCIADSILLQHQGILLAWYQDLDSASKYEEVYERIISYIIGFSKSSSVLFTGTSGGGYPAIKYASLYGASALVANCQLYLGSYFYAERLLDYFGCYADSILKRTPKDLFKRGKPKCLYAYQNKEDQHHYYSHYLPFVELCVDQQVCLAPCSFKGPDSKLLDNSPHGTQFPDSLTHREIINCILSANHPGRIAAEALIRDNVIKVSCLYLWDDFSDAEYAFYVISGKSRIAQTNYSNNPSILIHLEAMPLERLLQLVVFARDSRNIQKSTYVTISVSRI